MRKILTAAAVLALLSAGTARAQVAILPSVQAAFGSLAMSSGTQSMAFSSPQTAASVIGAGAQLIESGFFSQFLGVLAVSSTVAAGQPTIETVYTPNGPVTITIPPGAVPPGVTLTAQLASNVAPGSDNLMPLGSSAIQLDCGGCQPLKAVTITASFSGADLTGIDPTRLIYARFDPDKNAWVPQLSQVDVLHQVVIAQVRHFSIFQSMISNPATNLSLARVVPNPFRPAKGHAAMGIYNLPSSTRVRIYTIKGELIKDLTANGAGLAVWDGTNTSGLAVTSGIYYALLQGLGQSKTLTLAVQR